MHDAYGFDEIDVLLNTDAPNLREMDERFEKEFISIMRGRMAELGDDAVVEIVYRLVSELEDALCAADTPASRYCLEWLTKGRARRERGFEQAASTGGAEWPRFPRRRS